MSAKLTSTRLLAIFCGLVICSVSATDATEKEQKKTLGSTKTTVIKKTSKKNSLAAAASRIKLKTTDETGKKITISDHNIGELSKGGVVSTGGGVTGVETPTAATEPSGPQPASEDRQKEYDSQRAKVDALEKDIDAWEKEVAKGDPRYNNTVQQRPAGVTAPNDATRKEVNARLAAEKEKLKVMEKKAKKDGVTLEKKEQQK